MTLGRGGTEAVPKTSPWVGGFYIGGRGNVNGFSGPGRPHVGLIEVTGDGMLRRNFFEEWLHLCAMRHGVWAAGMETAPRWGVQGAGNFSGDHHRWPLLVGVRWQRRGKERLCI